jgi:hypothetical protein
MKISSEAFFIISSQIFLYSLLIASGASNSPNIHRLKSIECKSLDKKSMSVDYCFVKAYSRKLTTLNLKFDLHKKFPKPLYIQYILGRKTSGNYCQNIYKSDLIEFCGIMEGVDANPLIKNIFHLLNATAPQLLHKCPYEGHVVVTNVTLAMEKSIISFPSGTYCTEFNIFDDKKKQVIAVKMLAEVKNGFSIFGLMENNGN